MRRIYIAVILILNAGTAFSAEVSLPQILQGTLKNHPDLVSVERGYADRLADALETTTRDNPEVQLDVLQAENGGDAKASLEITQPLKISQWYSRPAYAAALRAAADTEQKAAVITVLNTVTAQYTQAWLLQERQQYLKRMIGKAEQVARIARAASKRGELPASELSILEAQNAELEQQILRLQSDFEAIADDLKRISGVQNVDKVAAADFSPMPTASDGILDMAQKTTNTRSVLQSQLTAANARLQVAQEDAAYPEFAPRLMWDRTLDDREDELGIGIAVKIPLWNRNDAEVSRARAEVASSRNALDRLRLDQQLINKHKRALSLSKQEAAYRQTILPKYLRSYDLTEKMFRAGQASLLTVWQVQREILNVQEKVLEISAESLTARLDLEAAMGGKIEEIQ